MRINENEGITFDAETSELKITKDYLTFTQRTFLPVSCSFAVHQFFDEVHISFNPSLEDFPFDIYNLSIKLELTSKTVILDVDDKTSNEPPQDLPGPQG